MTPPLSNRVTVSLDLSRVWATEGDQLQELLAHPLDRARLLQTEPEWLVRQLLKSLLTAVLEVRHG